MKCSKMMRYMSCCFAVITYIFAQNAFDARNIAYAEENSFIRGTGDIPLDTKTYNAFLKTLKGDFAKGYFNWMDFGVVTAAEDQGSCGSCWAFATNAALESHIIMYDGWIFDLSEQLLVSCDTSQYGCCGGTAQAIQWYETHKPVSDPCFPYGDSDTSCPYQYHQYYSNIPCDYSCMEFEYHTTNFHTIDASDPNQVIISIFNEGPGYFRFDYYTDFITYFNSPLGTPPWTDGVYVQSSGEKKGGHAVEIIGYDNIENYWICKNSWGANAGPFGYGTFKIAWSGHANDLNFGMANFDVVSASTYTPTNTPTRTRTPSVTPTRTRTPTQSPSATNTQPTSSSTPTFTSTRTPTSTFSLTATSTITETPTRTPSSTLPPTYSPTSSPTGTYCTSTPSQTPTQPPTQTSSPTSTQTFYTQSPTNSPTSPTATPTSTPTGSSVPTSTPFPVWEPMSLQLDSALEQCVRVDYDDDFNAYDDFTVEGWFNFSSLDTDIQSMVQFVDTGYCGWSLNCHYDTVEFFYHGGEAYHYSHVATGTIDSAETWHHVAAVKSGAQVSLYIDSVRTDVNDNSVAYEPKTSGYLYMGVQWTGFYQNLDGLIDEIAISDTARYTGETCSMSCPVVDGSTIAYWRFDRGNGTEVPDITGNGHTAILMNDPDFSADVPISCIPEFIYVDDDAPNDPGPGDTDVSDPDENGSPQHPFDSIQEAIDEAVDGYIVMIADGIYAGEGNKNLNFGGKSITLLSENGPEMTIINCEGSPTNNYRGFLFQSNEGENSIVDGITIQNGYIVDEHGGGIICMNSSPVIRNCRITNNFTNYDGGGIYCFGASPIIEDCSITENTALMGGGIILTNSSDPDIVNCLFLANDAVLQGGAVYTGSLSEPAFINCTISGNAADEGGGFYCHSGSKPTIQNCILWENIASQITACEEALVTCSDIQSPTGVYPGEGNINTDPIFATGPFGEYYLHPGSPCIDEGCGPSEEVCFQSAWDGICLNELTTQTDEIPDYGPVDIGFHYHIENPPTIPSSGSLTLALSVLVLGGLMTAWRGRGRDK